MVKRLLVSLFVCIVLSLFGVRSVDAQPATTNCSATCQSYSYWDGQTYGGAVSFVVSQPGFYNSTAYFARYLRLGSGSPRLFIGEVVNKGTGGPYCAGWSQAFFMYSWNTSGGLDFHQCFTLNSGDTNQRVDIQAYYDNNTCGTGGQYVTINSVTNHFAKCVGSTSNYNRMELHEEIQDNVSGHQVWGVYWVNSKYFASNGTYSYQSRGVDTNYANNPPQMYWYIVPNSNNLGGEMHSCDYDGSYTCTIGG